MSVKNILNRVVRAVIEEAERNPDFESALIEALSPASAKRKGSKDGGGKPATEVDDIKRGKNRRNPAAFDPVQLIRDGEPVLRRALEKLSLEQLRDIVADYGMDPGRLVMKWNTPERVVDRIVEMSVARAQKGNAFRKPVEDHSPPTPAEDATRTVDEASTQSQDDSPDKG
ncbi:hypothetical protein [Lysobacter enzymogenes]|uniref:hypothetical protein n=1 Tax=Lysobacter enzymogenes TaxID=69 RepID=UPI001A970726|nr:hypothetical protein [Lysobacter enzymogenes]QQP94999.1 hypothetical protein JHW38_17340 [Lysobacter enzymogenes]